MNASDNAGTTTALDTKRNIEPSRRIPATSTMLPVSADSVNSPRAGSPASWTAGTSGDDHRQRAGPLDGHVRRAREQGACERPEHVRVKAGGWARQLAATMTLLSERPSAAMPKSPRIVAIQR